jgi:hypothetical protein
MSASKVFWALMIALLLLTRIPAMASYMTVDNVNLAFSLHNFDPRVHQPQPPGYPLFVGFARILNFAFRDPERTFYAISLLVSALCLPVAVALGKRMFSEWAGAAAAFLLLVAPVFWHAGLDGPLRPNLALFSLLTGYCCWRCWNGEKQFAVWSAVALGIGSGFRPDLLAFLLPVWLLSVWTGTRSWRALIKASLVLGGIVGVWLGALIFAVGGVQSFSKIMLEYTVEQSQAESVVLGSSIMAWLRQVDRLFIWNALAVIGWIWAVPIYFRNRERLPIASSHGAFFFVWLVPGLIVQALIHVADPGHTAFSVPILCLLGGYVLSLVPAREQVLAAVLVFNTMLFLDFFPLPAEARPSDGRPSIKNAALYATFETSIGQVRYLDDVTRTALNQIRQFTPAGRPSMIITTDTYVNQYFMNWRIGRYYLPDRDFWVLYTRQNHHGFQRIRRDAVLDKSENLTVTLPIVPGARILWLVEPGSAFQKQLETAYKLEGGPHVFYTDIQEHAPAFKFQGFEIAAP